MKGGRSRAATESRTANPRSRATAAPLTPLCAESDYALTTEGRWYARSADLGVGMDKLRKPFFVAAVILIALVVLVETGTGLVQKSKAGKAGPNLTNQLGQVTGLKKQLQDVDLASSELKSSKPPGLGIPSMALLDGLVFFTVALMGAQFFLGERLHGRIQGIVNLIVSLLVLIAAIVALFGAVIKLMLMVALFLAVPFGTLAYLAGWGFFDTGAAKAVLGLLLLLKLGFAVCLVLSHQSFLKYKGLVLIIVSSFLANLIVSFLHGVVPSILVSITDGIAGIVVLILAAIWAIFLLIFSVLSLKAVLLPSSS